MSESVDNLAAAVDRLDGRTADLDEKVARLGKSQVELTTAMRDQQRETRRRTTVLAGFLVGVLIVLLATVPAMVKVSLDNRAAIAENNQRWCPVVAPLAPRADDPPPVGTPDQIQRSLRIRKAFSHLVEDFGCN